MEPKYSIVIITYNQEDVIGRAIDSVIIQNELVHEIIILDDCSTDSTWEVIKSYQIRYPDLIRSFRHQYNVGICKNIESSWKKISGDVFFYLAGDDILCEGLFEQANLLIRENKIDFKTEQFTLYFDYKTITPNGREYIGSNSLILNHNPISLKLRVLISNRTTGISKAVLDQFVPTKDEFGIFTDGLLDIQIQVFSKKNYYSAFVGSVYYSSIGITTRTKKNEALQSYITCLNEYENILKDLSSSDKNWIKYLKAKFSFTLNPSISTFFKYFNYLFKIIEFKYGWMFVNREIKIFIKLLYRNFKP